MEQGDHGDRELVPVTLKLKRCLAGLTSLQQEALKRSQLLEQVSLSLLKCAGLHAKCVRQTVQ